MTNPDTSFSLLKASFKVSITNLLSLFLDILYALEPLNSKYVTSVSHTLINVSFIKFLFSKLGFTLSSILLFLCLILALLIYSG